MSHVAVPNTRTISREGIWSLLEREAEHYTKLACRGQAPSKYEFLAGQRLSVEVLPSDTDREEQACLLIYFKGYDQGLVLPPMQTALGATAVEVLSTYFDSQSRDELGEPITSAQIHAFPQVEKVDGEWLIVKRGRLNGEQIWRT